MRSGPRVVAHRRAEEEAAVPGEAVEPVAVVVVRVTREGLCDGRRRLVDGVVVERRQHGASLPRRRSHPARAPGSHVGMSDARAAWGELLETLREAGERFAGEEWGLSAPDDVAGGLRLLAHLLEGGLVGHFEDDPRQPVFRPIVTSTRKSLGDIPGALY